MKQKMSLREFIAKARESDAYWVERAKNGFALALERWRRAKGLSNTELAGKIGTTPAYITKVFRGDTNFTIETMVKLARACGGELNIQIEEPRAAQRWLNAEVIHLHAHKRRLVLTPTAEVRTSVVLHNPGNEVAHNDQREALAA